MTDEIFYKDELNEKRISAYKKLAENYRVQEGTVRDIFSQGIAFAVSHTAAHTDALRERVKELEATLSINRYTLEDMRKSFYAGYSLCDDEWRDKRKLVGFDEFINNLK